MIIVAGRTILMENENQGKVKKKNKLVRKMKILGQKISQSCRRVLSVFRCRKRSTVEKSKSSSESEESSTEMSSSQVTSDVETEGTMNASLTSLNDVSETYPEDHTGQNIADGLRQAMGLERRETRLYHNRQCLKYEAGS
ncbi:uncharacterized protein LOC114456688 isoform X2 [Gouania willdenowi]|uniref:uncharacterized protein LOC114456688 isoform X2 n=1 Tax=Gouania willdenowi TaxID=441366 RepID=UPI001055D04E|nr:uncharacterized protein LOC114456688 isoform X2 [Gouania willdenowi]